MTVMICDKSYYMLLVYIIFNYVILNERMSYYITLNIIIYCIIQIYMYQNVLYHMI